MPRECSFQANDWTVLSRAWFPVARSDEVAEKPIAARLLDVDVVVYRTGAMARVARDLCSHRGAALSRGWVEDDTIVCPYHGFHYAPDGRCTLVPAHPELPISPKLRIVTFPTVERFGLIWCTLNGMTRACRSSRHGTIPSSSRSWRRPSTSTARPGGRSKASSMSRISPGRTPKSFGEGASPIVPTYKVERTARGIRAEYASNVSNYPRGFQHLAPPDFVWLRVFEVYPPFAARLIVHFPDGGRLWILNAASPIAARKTRLFCPLARNFDKDGPVDDVHKFNLLIFNEDRVIVESQRPEDLPLDVQMEAHIAADRTSIAYRKLLKEMGLGALYVS